MKRKLLLFALLLCLCITASAQNKTVSGKVTDAQTQEPVAGASITVEGSQAGVSTDANGAFSFSVPEAARAIRVTLLSYQTQTVTLTGQPLSISLVPDVKSLDEVVVTGYGTQLKKDVTGSVSSISSKDVADRRTVQISEALQGTMAGVTVTRSGSAPGTGSSIRIRGVTTIGTNDPLYIVDGVPNSNIDNINPNDVESITVLKDAASAAIYGSRGAAGVILVTTKRAKEGQSSLEYNFEYGLQKPTVLPEYVSPTDYMRYFNEQAVNDGASAGPFQQSWITGHADSVAKGVNRFPFFNTDWQKEILTNTYAPRMRHDLVFTMGTDKVRTKASFGYSKSGAFYDNYNYQRYLFRINNDLKISTKLNATLDLTYKRTETKSTLGALGEGAIRSSRLIPGVYGAFYSDGRYATGKDGNNPVAQIEEGGFGRSWLNQVVGRLAFNYIPVKGLTFTALVAPTIDLDKSKTFNKQIRYYDFSDPTRIIAQNQPRTILSEGRNEGFTINGQLLASYSTSIAGNHNIDALAGYEENYAMSEALGAARSGFAFTEFPYLNTGSLEFRENSGSASEAALRSFFGNLQYNYRSKYYLRGNLRYDQSSRFAREYRNALFPSVSAGWTISEEAFMKKLTFLSFLKLRAAWGKTGNERIGNYPYQANITFSNSLFYQNGVVVPLTGGGQVEYAVNDISWETTETTDAGIDATFLNNRLSLTANYFNKKTRDILLRLDIPNYLGYDNPFQNAGTLQAKGIELELGWRDRVGKFNYSIGLNFDDTKTKILDLKGTQFLGDVATLEGSEFNEWFGYRSRGLFQTAAEVAGSPVLAATTKAGDVRYEDVNGDGKITPADRVLLGGSLPRMNYGGNIRMDYKNIDFGVIFQGVGKRISRLSDDITRPFQAAYGNMPKEMPGRFWSTKNTPDQNLQAIYPRLSRTSETNNYSMSDFWLINGSYFRLKTLTLGYTLRENSILQKAGIKSVRIYASANDVFALSKFPKYWDPEVGTGTYPIVTTFIGGAAITF